MKLGHLWATALVFPLQVGPGAGNLSWEWERSTHDASFRRPTVVAGTVHQPPSDFWHCAAHLNPNHLTFPPHSRITGMIHLSQKKPPTHSSTSRCRCTYNRELQVSAASDGPQPQYLFLLQRPLILTTLNLCVSSTLYVTMDGRGEEGESDIIIASTDLIWSVWLGWNADKVLSAARDQMTPRTFLSV